MQKKLEALRPETTNKEKIYEYIKNKINSGSFQMGQSLRIAELADELHVSQTPVREALILLEGEALVDFRPYRGAVVKGLSKSELKEIFTIRMILENAALEFAIPHMTPEIFADAKKNLEEWGSSLGKEMYSERNWDFHELILKYAQMPLLSEIVNSLSARVKRYTYLYYLTEPDRFVSDHMLQLEAWEKGDIEEGKKLHKLHMDHVVALISPLLPD